MPHLNKKATVLLLLLLYSLTLVGCWDNHDLGTLSLISAIGIDRVDDSTIELTLQIINPSALKSSESSSGYSNISPVTTMSVTGETISGTMANIFKKLDKSPFLSDVKVVVIGEELAREGITDYLDFFERYSRTKRRAYLLIAKDLKAKEVLKTVSTRDKIPADHIAHIMGNSKISGGTSAETIIDFIQCIEKPGHDDVISTVSLDKNNGAFNVNNLIFEGGSVIKNGKLIGWLNKDEILAFLVIQKKVNKYLFTIPNSTFNSKKATVKVQSQKIKIDTLVEGDKPRFNIDLSVIGDLIEMQGDISELTPEYWSKLENELKKAMEILIKDTINTAQNKYQSDIFGFCEKLRIKDVDLWKEVIDKWDVVFQECSVEVNVKVVLRRSSIIKQPIQIH